VVGAVIGALDWPFRLVVAPMAVATAATQATPDGRRPERFAFSWLALRLAPTRRSLGRDLCAAEWSRRHRGTGIWMAPDAKGLRLRHARITGPGTVHFAEPIVIRRRRLRGGLVAGGRRRFGRRARPSHQVALRSGQTLEVRP
jgi:hypothetical protein